MKDSRGVDRGRCSQCRCEAFQQADGQSVRCSCGHSPTKHQNLSSTSSPAVEASVADAVLPTAIDSTVRSAAAVDATTQDETGLTLCALPDCNKPAQFDPNTGESWDVCRDHLDHSQDVSSGPSFQFPGFQMFKAFQQVTLGGRPVSRGQGDNALAPKCRNPSCFRACYRKENGTYFDFCGITCRNKYKTSTSAVATDGEDDEAPPCRNPSCRRTCYPKGDGTYFDFCGLTCRNLSSSQAPSIPAILCSLPGCKLPQDSQGRYDGYCGDAHRNQAYCSKVIVEMNCHASEFKEVSRTFTRQWVKPSLKPAPTDLKIFKVYNQTLATRFQTYAQSLGDPSKEEHFHGTVLCCDLANSKSACAQPKCGICGISRRGFDPGKIGSNIARFKRFGMGMYLAPDSSKCHDYTQGCKGYRALILCDVAPGRKYILQRDQTKLKAPPQGYDSVYGQHGGNLNYDEIVLYNKDAILPKYVIMYQKNGEGQIAA